MGRIQNYKNWSPAMVPDQSRTSLGLEYFLWDSDDEWTWSQDRLLELGVNECVQLGLVERDEVEDGTVVRMKKAYPIYDQDYQNHVDVIRRYLATIPNLQTVGRNGLHRYNNQDHSMLTAVYAARNIDGADYDVWSVNTEQEYHEEDRGEETAAAGDRATPKRVRAAEMFPETPDELIKAAFAHLDPLALGLAVGLVFGVSLFLATAVLLIKGGEVVGPNLSLLAHYFVGFKATWSGAFIGLFEAGIGGFILGYLVAVLRNYGMKAYAHMVKRRADAEAERDLLNRL